jgi:hypothetical protein
MISFFWNCSIDVYSPKVISNSIEYNKIHEDKRAIISKEDTRNISPSLINARIASFELITDFIIAEECVVEVKSNLSHIIPYIGTYKVSKAYHYPMFSRYELESAG